MWRPVVAAWFVLAMSACGSTSADAPPSATAAAPTATASPTPTSPTPQPRRSATATPTPTPLARSGAEVLVDSGFASLRGRRVGLIANQTSLAYGEPLAQLLARDPGVDLVALFAPEHGATGSAGAGDLVDDGTDPLLGIPVYSLYGSTRAPTTSSLAGLDTLVYDLQDVGTRFYTYISTMGLAMQAAAAADVTFFVLDRPNPQGDRLGGFARDNQHTSFVSQYPIPTSYGMTAGELAQMIVGEAWLPGLADLDVRVIEVDGWDSSAPWPSDQLPWVPPSPALPSAESALAYPGLALFEATAVSEGRGTDTPFQLIGAPWVDAGALAATLERLDLPGVHFEAATFSPRQLASLTAPPRFDGEQLHGIRVVIDDPATFRSVETGIHVLVAVQAQARAAGQRTIIDRPDGFDLLAGTTQLRQLLEAGAPAPEIIETWNPDLEAFAQLRAPYRIYH